MIVLVAGEPAAVLRLTTKQQVYCCLSYHDSTTTGHTLHFPIKDSVLQYHIEVVEDSWLTAGNDFPTNHASKYETVMHQPHSPRSALSLQLGY